MSEPQHPFGTESNADRPTPGSAPSPVQAVPDTLAAAGARFAQLREAKGWAVEDVSARLKVSISKLRALEAGDLTQLPDTTFALGVVRSYAKMLDADPTPFTQALRRERGVLQQDLSMPASAGGGLPRGRVSVSLGGSGPSRRGSWLWGVAAVIVAVIAIAMWHTNSGESSAWFARLKSMANDAHVQPNAATVTEGQTTGASAAQGDQAQAPADAQASDAAPASAAPAAAGSAPQAAVAAPAAPANAAPTNAAPANAAPVNAAPANAAPASAARANAAPASAAPAAHAPAASAPAAPAAATTPAATTQASGADTSTFAIRVTQDTWVSVRQKDGKEVFSGLIHGSDAREIAGTGPLKITVGNKAGIESMTIDGQPVDASKYASARGNVARFVLP
ncbi:MAG: helix-turn-helix domain-containing protein [Paraburkholderia sp.]|uniref:helix-turn-helix domain-containing protein n=1 Tax=Paraburkholderia sp. TaxID=1926495 RepID=UPI00121491C5|nr:helix-turn-helix domain-containing protein [Paraburkholderia sp.]TAM07082.1 MAG: helix-turn-helix domain-containing protein [Paraburkholderia sp.]TAM32540.1 MAG: helix-turn-helix domain-containing protein [Paraburkholderia sp.]